MTTHEVLSNVQFDKPCWSGPQSPSKNGGVTQSLLGKFIACPARFKALVIDNLKPKDKFNHRIHYGNMFHLCYEYHESGGRWKTTLEDYTNYLLKQYPFSQEEILKWSRVCQIQLPIYLEFWEKQDSNSNGISLLQEEVFHVPYKLPSGRTVYLRGRWDAVELVDNGVWLVETKTKGDVDREKIERRLKYDLQTMIYLVAWKHWEGDLPVVDADSLELKGVQYNVIRRPLSGGKGTIKQTKNETIDEYYDRLAQYIKDEPETYFYRWQSEVSNEDIHVFEDATLIPILERLCDWWTVFGEGKILDHPSPLNWVTPFGVNQITDEYGSEYDDYIQTGSTVGLESCTNLFPELNGE